MYKPTTVNGTWWFDERWPSMGRRIQDQQPLKGTDTRCRVAHSAEPALLLLLGNHRYIPAMHVLFNKYRIV